MIQLELINSLAVEEVLLTRLAFSPDGAEIALGHKHFRTYATETGAARAAFAFPDLLAQLRYSPDGRFIAAANVGDNHPGTRGRAGLFEATTGDLRWSAEAPRAVETLAFAGRERLYWNAGAVLAGAQCDPYAALPPIALPDLEVRALATNERGFVCFGREAAGSIQQVEGADLVFRKFRIMTLDREGRVHTNFDLGIGAGVHALSPDGRLLAAEMVDFKNNERHVSLIDVETGVEANLLPLEANTLPVLAFGSGSEYFLCMKEDGEGNFNLIRVWRTADLKLLGEARVELAHHALAVCLEHSLIACVGGGTLEIFALQ